MSDAGLTLTQRILRELRSGNENAEALLQDVYLSALIELTGGHYLWQRNEYDPTLEPGVRKRLQRSKSRQHGKVGAGFIGLNTAIDRLRRGTGNTPSIHSFEQLEDYIVAEIKRTIRESQSADKLYVRGSKDQQYRDREREPAKKRRDRFERLLELDCPLVGIDRELVEEVLPTKEQRMLWLAASLYRSKSRICTTLQISPKRLKSELAEIAAHLEILGQPVPSHVEKHLGVSL